MADGETVVEEKLSELDLKHFLDKNDSYTFFQRLDAASGKQN